jgi:phospholipase C
MLRHCRVRVAPLVMAVVASALLLGPAPVRADGNLNNVNHFIFAMQENHSFDNYFGVIPFVPGSPYHAAHGKKGCPATDNTCVDALRCKVLHSTGQLSCRNANTGNMPSPRRIRSFHDPRYCTGPDLDHSWIGSHMEGNFQHPNNMLKTSRNNGFVRVNAASDPPAQVTDHDAMGYYTDADLPFYYGIAETFAMSDRYFAAVIGQTFPNRAYFGAGTSFGHLTTNEIIHPGGYQPINGTIYDRLDAAGVTWKDYFSDLPYSQIFKTSPGHTFPVSTFMTDLTAGTLPQVSFVDPSAFPDQTINGKTYETDEHPPQDIRAGEYFVWTIINALRNSSSWHDSVLFLTYDEHGGFYDHVKPPPADQGGASTPDGIAPGQCADASNPPASEQPGGGVTCTHSSTMDAPGLCPAFTPTGPYPANCATFNQLGFRLPLVAVSPFSKAHYVSHTIGSHTSFLAMLEKRFSLPSLGARDAHANTLEDMFDFDTSPSLATPVGTAPLPQAGVSDPNCPFNGSPSGAFIDNAS